MTALERDPRARMTMASQNFTNRPALQRERPGPGGDAWDEARPAGVPGATEREAPRWCPALRTQGIGLSAGCGSSPPLSATKLSSMPARQRPVKSEPTPPPADVRQLQDPDHTKDDFLRDLEKASTNRAAERLAEDDPSRPDREPSGT